MMSFNTDRLCLPARIVTQHLLLSFAFLIFVHSVQALPPDARLAAERVLDSVFVVGVATAEGHFVEVGTAWTISPRYLVTNAHVAEQLEAAKGPRDRIVAKRGIFDRNELVLGESMIHPAYHQWNDRLARMINRMTSEAKLFDLVPVADVALMEIMVGDPGPALRVMTGEGADIALPRIGGEAYYAGYPMENLSGFATMHFVPIRITALTDYFFQRTDWRGAYLIHMSGRATGGASGSPVVNDRGEVLGILAASDNLSLYAEGGERRRVGVGFVYAQRADLALELLNATAENKQMERNQKWLADIKSLFLSADDIIKMTINGLGRFGRTMLSDWTLITSRQDYLTEMVPELTIPIALQPGYRYLFISAADDGTDIDSYLIAANQEYLDRDTLPDQVPLIVFDNHARQRVLFRIQAAEAPLERTHMLTQIYRMPIPADTSFLTPSQLRSPDSDAVGEVFHMQAYEVSSPGFKSTALEPIQASTAYRYLIRAVSQQERDIDLVARQNGVVIAADHDLDHYPVLLLESVSGPISIDLILPATSRIGDVVDIFYSRIGKDDLYATTPGESRGVEAWSDWRTWVGERVDDDESVDNQTGFAGAWRTTFGVMHLQQEGHLVTGTYAFGGGSALHGTLTESGKRYTFVYTEPGDIRGEGWFQLSVDGQSFSGQWRQQMR